MYPLVCLLHVAFSSPFLELLESAPFFVIPWAFGPRNTFCLVSCMADRSTDQVDIAILIDSELRDIIRHHGLDIPREATRTELVAAPRLRASQDATHKGESLAGSDHAVASLCSALSDLTDVVRELKAEITAMKGMEDKFQETYREVVWT